MRTHHDDRLLRRARTVLPPHLRGLGARHRAPRRSPRRRIPGHGLGHLRRRACAPAHGAGRPRPADGHALGRPARVALRRGRLACGGPGLRPHAVRVEQGARLLAYQLWEWDGDCYDLHMYLTRDPDAGPCETRVFRSRYYAIGIARLLQLLAEAGFAQPRRLDDIYFQPLLTARRPG